MKLSAFVILPTCTLLAACSHTGSETVCSNARDCHSILVSTPVSSAPQYTSGVIYSLPSQQLEFTATRNIVTAAKLDEAVKAASEALSKITLEANNQSAEVKLKEEALTAASAGTPELKAKLGLETELAKIQLLVLEQRKTAAQVKLAAAQAARQNFDLNNSATLIQDQFELKALTPVPDRNLRYVAQLRRGGFSSENYEIKTTEQGLLTGGNGKSEGQMDDVLVALSTAFNTVHALKQPGAPSAFTKMQESMQNVSPPVVDPCGAPDKTTVKVQFSIEDLGADKTVELVHAALSKARFCYSLISRQGAGQKPKIEDPGKFLNGLVYPTSHSMRFDLQTVSNGIINPGIEKSFFPVVLDTSVLGVLPLDSAFFSVNEYEYEFKNGALTRFKSATPNEALAFLGLFPRAAKELISIPGELIKLKIDYSTNEKAYYEAQIAAMELRLDLQNEINAQQLADQTSAVATP